MTVLPRVRLRAFRGAKGLATAVIRFSGLTVLARRTWTRRRVGIVVYHDPSVGRLDAHLGYLARRYSFVGIAELESAMALRDWTRLPSNPLMITFDDGHAGNAALVPVLAKHGVRPVIYVCPGVSEGDGQFWFTTPGIDTASLKLMTTAARAAVLDQASAGGHRPHRDALWPSQIRDLALVADIGSHTLTHPILPLCSDTEAEREIRDSRSRVAEMTTSTCLHFSYPNGDYSTRDVRLVRDAGYTTARTTEAGWNGPSCDPLRLKIASLADHCSVNDLAAHLAGLFLLRRHRRDAVRRRQLQALGDRGSGNDVRS